MSKSLGHCAECGQYRKIECRGCCRPCYTAHMKAGTLDAHPRMRKPQPQTDRQLLVVVETCKRLGYPYSYLWEIFGYDSMRHMRFSVKNALKRQRRADEKAHAMILQLMQELAQEELDHT